MGGSWGDLEICVGLYDCTYEGRAVKIVVLIGGFTPKIRK